VTPRECRERITARLADFRYWQERLAHFRREEAGLSQVTVTANIGR
jgi:hypothetical protein